MPVTNLQDLLLHELRDLYSAEVQLLSALPKMIDESTDPKLSEALREHLEVTKVHKQRLDTIDDKITFSSKTKECEGLKGIIAEAEKGLQDISDSHTKDAAIIASAQKAEHYEIASYGSAAEFARQLNLSEVADLLEDTLDEEKEADEALTSLAEGGFFSEGVNEKAAEA